MSAAEHRELTRLYEGRIWPAIQSLRGLAKRVTRCDAAAEDLMQITALRAWRYIATFREDSNACAWVRTIMVHAWINQCRRNRGHQADVEVSTIADASPAMDDVVLDNLEFAETMRDVVAAIDVVAERSPLIAQAMRLRFGLDGHLTTDDDGTVPLARIAEAMDVQPGTIMSRLSRGRHMVRAVLAGEVSGGEGIALAEDEPLKRLVGASFQLSLFAEFMGEGELAAMG
jgi:RNA polymerase sigma factor (sigma-70 family)